MSAENAWKVAREILATMPTKYLSRCPMPPAFREEVEAEAEELRGMLSEVRGWLDPRRSREVATTCARIDALLSRLEAKGESHE